MRHESSVTSLSWIPSEAITGVTRFPIDAGFGHYDDPPPDELTSLPDLQAADRFRFANELRAWIEVDDGGQITDAGFGHYDDPPPDELTSLAELQAADRFRFATS